VVLDPDIPLRLSRNGLVAALKAIWRTLDPEQSEQFRQKLEAAAGDRVIRRKTAGMLAVAFTEIAYHKRRTRGKGPFATCYKMTTLGGTLYGTREKALKQLELLQSAREKGKIDEETAAKAHAVLAQEVEMLHRAKASDLKTDWRRQREFVEEYKAGKVKPGDVATVAADMIVQMEGASSTTSPAERLAAMKERVEKLLNEGPYGNDWWDPDIRPNVTAVLEKAGLVKQRKFVTCYDRGAAPVQARSDELKELQKQLLDNNVKAGILDVETARKAAQAVDTEPPIDYATEKDVRDYQKKLRRIVRLLYKKGELPASFVGKLAEAADIEIIAFDSAKALRDDARWHFASLFWEPIGRDIIKILEERRLVPVARNHRRIMKYFGPAQELSEHQKKQLADFAALLDADAFTLDGDEKVRIAKSQIPADNSEYRIELRKVCRALIKIDLVRSDRLESFEKVIAIPLIGVLEGA
ncbi:MAG: hypothetical protein ACYS8Z_24035, partial [Planctomycetota bacterium]|jgi:hypothetical protein